MFFYVLCLIAKSVPEPYLPKGTLSRDPKVVLSLRCSSDKGELYWVPCIYPLGHCVQVCRQGHKACTAWIGPCNICLYKVTGKEVHSCFPVVRLFPSIEMTNNDGNRWFWHRHSYDRFFKLGTLPKLRQAWLLNLMVRLNRAIVNAIISVARQSPLS